MNVLLLGATGVTGRRTAIELMRHGRLDRLTLAGRDLRALENIAKLLHGSTTIEVDAFDLISDEVVPHFRGHHVVVSCAGPGYELEERSIDAAIVAGTHYVSLNDDDRPGRAVALRDEEARARGVTIVSGCGLAPGISNLLVALASKDLDEVSEVEVSAAGSSADPAGPATDLHFVYMLQNGGSEQRDGRSPHPVYFPEPVGWVETFACDHPEEVSLRALYPTLETFRFRVGLAEKAVMDTVRAGAAAGLASTDRRRRSWLKAARPLRPLLQAISPGSGAWTALRVDVHGTKSGRTRTISYGVVDRLVNLASIPLVLCALSLADAPRGVTSIERVGEPAETLKKIATRGIRFGELEPHAW